MGVDRPIDITADQRKTILALLKRHLPNTTAWVYGSRVKWTSRPQSDLDLVVFTKPDQERRVSELKEAFEESNLPFRIDLLVWRTLPEPYRRQIEAEHVVLVESDGEPFERTLLSTPGNRIEATIDDIVASSRNAIVGGPFGSNLVSRDYVPEGVPVIRGQNMGNRWVAGDFVFVTPQKAKSLEANLARPGDIVLTQRGTLGQVSLVPLAPFDSYLVSQSQMKVTVNREIADPLFFYYVLSSVEQQDYVRQNAIQTGVPHTNLGILRSTPVPVPSLDEQRAIAHILGTLDDKIELNRRMNETLEAMARALFKSWFIDFDPVRAKAALRNHSPLEGESASQGRSPQAHRWGEIKRQYTQQTLQNAQTLRETRTDAEGLLWHYLRDKQLDGYKFRRQQPIGSYIVDFACMPQKLLIELDGGQHAEQHAYDQKRDAFLREKGYTILRFWNHELFENCFGVLESIYEALAAPLSDHSPLEGESARQGRSPQARRWGDKRGSKDASLSGRGHPPPHQPSPVGSASATPPQGGSDWTVERARAYLDSMDKEIAALFPDRFVDSELGPIPEGWDVSTIGQEVDVVGGSTPSTKNPSFWNGTINWATPKDLSSLESSVLVETSRKITEKGLDKISSGLLPRGTVLLSSRAPIGYLAISDVPVAINQGFIAMKCQKRLSATYVWLWTAANMPAILENANGSTFQEISKSNFRPLRMIVPDVSVRKTYDKLMQRLYDRIVKNERQSRSLATLRDALLPKLISGELHVENVIRILSKGMSRYTG